MKTKRDVDDMLYHHLSANAIEFEAPSLSAMNEARFLIAARKKTDEKKENIFIYLWQLLIPDLKLYRIGMSVLIICAFTIYFKDTRYSSASASDLIVNNQNGLAIKNSTISVTSATMLTSIPTLVIRN